MSARGAAALAVQHTGKVEEMIRHGPFRVVAVTIDPSDEETPLYATIAENFSTLDAACDCADDFAKGSDHIMVAAFEVRDRCNIRRTRDGRAY